LIWPEQQVLQVLPYRNVRSAIGKGDGDAATTKKREERLDEQYFKRCWYRAQDHHNAWNGTAIGAGVGAVVELFLTI
jgi:hypothetical protein